MTQFIILCPPRTGSTMLRTTLNQHPEICCHGELLGRNRVLGHVKRSGQSALDQDALIKLRRTSICNFITNQAFETDYPISGFKLLYTHVGDPQFYEGIEALLQNTDIHVIHLWRRNLIAANISHAVWQKGLGNADRQTARNNRFVLEEKELGQICRNQITFREWARRAVTNHPYQEMDYETLLEEPIHSLNILCRFLGASEDVLSLPEKSDLSAKPQEFIENFEQISSSRDLEIYKNYA